MRGEVGQDYFDTHFTLRQAEVAGDLLKATYAYNYPPYVTDHRMTLFLDASDASAARVSEREVSTVLLAPQHFDLDEEEAVVRASDRGLDSDGPVETELRIGPETNHRFAWWITGPVDESVEAPPGSLITLALDVETGQVHVRELVGIDTNQ